MFTLQDYRFQRKDNKILFNLELPGVPKDSLSINYEDGIIVIEGVKKYPLDEHEGSKFKRSFRVGDIEPDLTCATLKDGILSLELTNKASKKIKII